MRSTRVLLGALTFALARSSAIAAIAPADCAAMNNLLRTARSDFPSLRQMKMEPGRCSFRAAEYRCGWHFPGDAFDKSDEQAKRLVGCVASYTAAQPAKARGGDSAFSIDPDLTVVIPAPQLDGDGWNVLLTIRSSYQQQ